MEDRLHVNNTQGAGDGRTREKSAAEDAGEWKVPASELQCRLVLWAGQRADGFARVVLWRESSRTRAAGLCCAKRQDASATGPIPVRLRLIPASHGPVRRDPGAPGPTASAHVARPMRSPKSVEKLV
jgi:hypothetical protein